MIRQLVSNCDLALIWCVHLLRQELYLLMMKIARTDQLSPVDSLLIVRYVSSCLALHCVTYLGLCLYLASLIASLK